MRNDIAPIKLSSATVNRCVKKRKMTSAASPSERIEVFHLGIFCHSRHAINVRPLDRTLNEVRPSNEESSSNEESLGVGASFGRFQMIRVLVQGGSSVERLFQSSHPTFARCRTLNFPANSRNRSRLAAKNLAVVN